MAVITITTNLRILMDNKIFIDKTGLTDAEFVDLTGISPMSVWKKFIGVSEIPDRTVRFEEVVDFQDTFMQLLAASNVKPDDRLFVSIGGDSSGGWIGVTAENLCNVWKSGLQQQTEIECAILLSDKVNIIGITAEEGDEYWFFRRLV